MFSSTFSRSARCIRPILQAPISTSKLSPHRRLISTLPDNPHIYVFTHPLDSTHSILTLLPTSPPTPSLAIGTTTAIPPTPSTFQENPQFLPILQSVFHNYASLDPESIRQASVFASPGGFNLGGTGRRSNQAAGGPASAQGGMGGANRGGHIHVSDTRNPPDWGRIAWPEDIFGSLEVDGEGRFVEGRSGGVGNYQDSGTYRIVTREGILGLPPFLREKVVERLRELEEKERGGK